MGLNRRTPPNSNSGKDFDPIPNLEAGEHDGRLVYVADLGLQRKEYRGEYTGDIQQIALGIEIVGETVEIDGEEKPRLLWTTPFYIYDKMGEKSNEFAYYKIFEPKAEPETVADWEAQLGKPCNVVVKHTKKEDKVYDNISALSSIPSKYHDGIEKNVIEPAIGDADDEDNPVNEKLYGLTKYVFDRRIASKPATKYNDQPAPSNLDDFDDDIPF